MRLFDRRSCQIAVESALLLVLFYAYAGDAPPMVNEAHYWVKAKNFWDSSFCANDLFAASGKAQWFYYLSFGWLTKYFSFATSAWIGRWVGWSILAAGLVRLSRCCGSLTREQSPPHERVDPNEPIHHESSNHEPLFHKLEHSPSPVIIALVWIMGIHYGNLAGEWVVGGIEAKVPAYGFVLFGIAELLRRNWNRVWVLLGIASAFHVLTGGWSVIAALIAWWLIERTAWTDSGTGLDSVVKFPLVDTGRRRLMTRWLFLGGAFSLLGVIPAALISMGATAHQSSLAAQTYSYFRLSHHLSPSSFHLVWYLRFGILSSLTLGLLWWQGRGNPVHHKVLKALSAWTWGAVAIGACGLIVGMLPPFAPDFAAKLLRFYWFRLPDAVLPLTLGILVACMLTETHRLRRMVGSLIALVAVVLLVAHCVAQIRRTVPPSVDNRLLGWDRNADSETLRDVYQDWLLVCYWARESTPTDEVFLTPRHQQTFKWFAQRAEVVNWKDVPQDSVSLVEWRRRFEEVIPARLNTVRVTINYQALRKYRKEYGVSYMIVDRRVCGENLPLIRLYPQRSEDNSTYAVYELPR